MSNPSEPDAVDATASVEDGEAVTPAGDGDTATPELDAGPAAEDVAAGVSAAEAAADAEQSEPATEVLDSEAVTEAPADAATEVIDSEAVTEVIAPEGGVSAEPEPTTPERRFTAPGFDASETEVIPPLGEAATQLLPAQPGGPERVAALMPPKLTRKLPPSLNRSWAWVLVLVFVILALAAVAVLGTLWLTRESRAQASREEAVRTAIENFDLAIQEGNLAKLRTLTCGTVRDSYVNYNDDAWNDTYQRIAAAKQYPVVASIDEVVVSGDHAEANVTAFMAFAPQIRSTRSLDLQYRDDQWKICQTRGG